MSVSFFWNQSMWNWIFLSQVGIRLIVAWCTAFHRCKVLCAKDMRFLSEFLAMRFLPQGRFLCPLYSLRNAMFFRVFIKMFRVANPFSFHFFSDNEKKNNLQWTENRGRWKWLTSTACHHEEISVPNKNWSVRINAWAWQWQRIG